MESKRRQFTREFKAEALRLLDTGGRPLSQVARELGIRADILRAWKRQAEGRAGLIGYDGTPLDESLTQEEQIRRLRRENEVLKQERDFLKKAAAYFAKESP
jgi:transposase